ncbi:hypothetical protein F511_29641 [Dorcoceras hygrometricum]|uniref:Uncharacterized protein n=1 Tax=Dorcoceras hygrometricum TaxID=472368 RepID=A0A2Z7C7W5_9LAMI|nr:hypothetical protein F511_29641 [Dorcoceras hygrometricum]
MGGVARGGSVSRSGAVGSSCLWCVRRIRKRQSRHLKLNVDACLLGLLELQKAYPYIFHADVLLMDYSYYHIDTYAFTEGGKTNAESLLMWTREDDSDWPTTH